MQDAETLKAKLLRCSPAIAWAGTALAVALVGLPTQPNSPFHHWLLAYLVVASVVAATVFCRVRAGSRARTALLSFAVSIAFVLNLSAFNTLLAGNDASLDFLAGLIGAQPEIIRAALVLLFAIFATLLTTTWRHVLGFGDPPRVSSEQGRTSNSVPSCSTKPAATAQAHHRPKRASSPRSATAPNNVGRWAAEQSGEHDEPDVEVHSGGRRQTSTCDAHTSPSMPPVDRWKPSDVAMSAEGRKIVIRKGHCH